MNPEIQVVICGGGIVGLATAFQILKRNPEASVVVIEKELEVAAHQTGHNSGVIHSGIYYRPESQKARLCREGREELIEFAKVSGVPFEICGKLIVATEESELEALGNIFERGKANGIEGIRMLESSEIKEFEPYCEGLRAIHIPGAGIIDFGAISRALMERIGSFENARVVTGEKVTELDLDGGGISVTTTRDTYRAEHFVNCGGLQCDRIAEKTSEISTRIIPFRGDYYELSEIGKEKVRHLIYPVPDPQFPFLGVHFTRMIDGEVECGPNAVFSFHREGYHKLAFRAADTLRALAWPGTWKLFSRHWRYGWFEMYRAFSRQKFLESLQKLIPALEDADIQPGRCGIRAAAVERNGDLSDDFVIERSDRVIHVLNAPSPAATSSLAIGRAIAAMVDLN